MLTKFNITSFYAEVIFVSSIEIIYSEFTRNIYILPYANINT